LGSSTLPLPTISSLAVVGTKGAFLATDGTETGSPGTIIPDVPPVAAPDSVTTMEDIPATFNVLGNDTDADGDSVKILSFTQSGHGTLTNNGSGNFTYTPAANFNGSDSFNYTITDGKGGTATAAVSITVSAVNDAPVAVGETLTTNEDVPLTIVGAGVLTNDTDVENNPLTAILVSGPSHGTLTLNASGSFTYTPAANFNGTDSFTYKANDGTADSNVATVTLTVKAVNDAPVAVGETLTTNEDVPLTVVGNGVLTNDTDVDSDTLTAILVTGPSHGTLTLNASGSFTYTPAANFNGTDSFTYKANDGTADSNVATVTLTVKTVNDAPLAKNDHFETDKHTTLTVTGAGVLRNDSDVDSTALTAILVTGTSHGKLKLNADGTFTYTPDKNFNKGTDTFTYRVSDGTLTSNLATVTITVGEEHHCHEHCKCGRHRHHDEHDEREDHDKHEK
jgi:VCBS repeat-containing protein